MKKPVKKNAKKTTKKTVAKKIEKPVKHHSPEEIEMVKNVGIIYERVKFYQTGEPRVIVSRKSPEKSVNFEHLHKFTKLAKAHDLLPGFYFHSMYADGKKVIVSKPECAFINKKTNLHFYSEYIKTLVCDDPDKELFIENFNKTKHNIEIFLNDNNINQEEDYHKQFFHINHLGKEYPDWIVMLKLGIISPYLLFLNEETLKFAKFLKIKNQNNSIDVYVKHYNELNKGGKLKELLNVTFEFLI